MKCVAIVPSVGPPRVRRSALRLITAETALRTLTLFSGGIVELSEMYRLPSLGRMWNWGFCAEVSPCWRMLTGGAAKSPLIRSLPLSVWRLATVTSLPPLNMIWLKLACTSGSVDPCQLGLRTRSRSRPAEYPELGTVPVPAPLIMYGPVNTWCIPYVDWAPASYLAA